jgi:hypothetical protein
MPNAITVSDKTYLGLRLVGRVLSCAGNPVKPERCICQGSHLYSTCDFERPVILVCDRGYLQL